MRPNIYYRTDARDIDATIALGVKSLMVLDRDMEMLGIDPARLGHVSLGLAGDDWDILAIGDKGVRHYNQSSEDEYDPYAVYPIWRIEDGYTALADMCIDPSELNSKYPAALFSEGRGKRFEATKQPHKIYIDTAPDLNSPSGLVYYHTLVRMARAHPWVGFILGESYSFRTVFSGTFSDSGMNVISLSRYNARIILPNGKTVGLPEASNWSMWIHELGFTVKQLVNTKGRVAFNLASIQWALKNYQNLSKFRLTHSRNSPLTLSLSDVDYEDASTRSTQIKTRRGLPISNANALPGDGLVCSTCSFMNTCKFFREGSVCAVPKSDGERLAKLMGSRDANKIIDALSGITQIQARRLGKDLEDEELTDERSYDTDKRLKDLFDSGQKLARLVDPTLNGKGTTVNVGVGISGGGGPLQVTSSRATVSDAVRELEQAGFSRAQITPALITNVINGASADSIEKSASREAEIIDAEVIE